MLKQVIAGTRSLLTGLRVTLKGAMKRPVTQRYPHVKPDLPEAYRGAIQFVRFAETGTHDCVACLQCANTCPSFCITIEGHKPEGLKKKRPTQFEVDFALCSLCGLCIDVCPTNTLEYSRLYDEAGYTREWTYDLLESFRAGEEAYLDTQRAREAEAAAAKAAAAAKPKAEPSKAEPSKEEAP